MSAAARVGRWPRGTALKRKRAASISPRRRLRFAGARIDKPRVLSGRRGASPFADGSFDVVTNIESSHTYPNLRAFYAEVHRVLISGGEFLYTDLLPVQRWAEVQLLLKSLGFTVKAERHITPNVLASCDDVAATRAQAFGDANAMIDNFLAVPGSAVYEQMKSGAWEYRILRAQRA